VTKEDIMQNANRDGSMTLRLVLAWGFVGIRWPGASSKR
jgi:hypothetical protein